jgi:hypothetical protein
MKPGISTRKIDSGPGGYRCTCCGPAPGKPRKLYRRKVRLLRKRQDRKRIAEELNGRA